MIPFEFGDIVLVPFPFTDQTTSKKRPAVVISSQSYQQRKPDIILMAISSQVSNVREFGEVLVEEWQAAGLIKPSIVKPVATTLEQRLVLKRLGRLAGKDRMSLKNMLLQIFSESVATG